MKGISNSSNILSNHLMGGAKTQRVVSVPPLEKYCGMYTSFYLSFDLLQDPKGGLEAFSRSLSSLPNVSTLNTSFFPFRF